MLRNIVTALAIVATAIASHAADPAGPTGQQILPVLAGYPKNVRVALLELAAQPALLAKLEKKDPNAPLAPLLAGASADAKAAAQLLVKYPDILKLLQSQPVATSAIGKLYSQDKKKVLDQLDEEAKAQAEAVDAWTGLLGSSPEALAQLKQAIAAYQKQLANATAADAANYAGVTLSPTSVNVTALPSPGFINYTMNNADLYPALANVMVGQWLSRRNSFAYDHAFNHWWDHYHDHFHHDLLKADADRANRLAELARYDRRFAKDEKRLDKFGEHRKEFPHLGKIGPPAKEYKPEPGKKPPLKELPRKYEPALHVHRAQPTEHQHVQHAAESQRGHAAAHHGRR